MSSESSDLKEFNTWLLRQGKTCSTAGIYSYAVSRLLEGNDPHDVLDQAPVSTRSVMFSALRQFNAFLIEQGRPPLVQLEERQITQPQSSIMPLNVPLDVQLAVLDVVEYGRGRFIFTADTIAAITWASMRQRADGLGFGLVHPADRTGQLRHLKQLTVNVLFTWAHRESDGDRLPDGSRPLIPEAQGSDVPMSVELLRKCCVAGRRHRRSLVNES